MNKWDDKLSRKSLISSLADLHSQLQPEGSLATKAQHSASGQEKNKLGKCGQ